MKQKIFTFAAMMFAAMNLSAADPIAATCAEAKAAMPAQHNDETQEVYIVTGYVTNTNGAISPSRTDPSIDQQTFYMDDEKGTKKTVQGYWCNLPGHEALNVGDKITVTGKILNYNNTPEIKNGDVAILERASVKIDTIDVSVCEALEEGSSLNPGDYSNEIFRVSGRLKGRDQVNNHGQHTFEMACGEDVFKPYNCTGAEGLELAKGDSVVVIGKLYNYNGTIEISNGKVELIEKSGEEETIIEATVKEAKDVAMALEKGKTTEDRYAVTGYVDSIAIVYSEQYSNISFFMCDDMANPTYDFEAYRVICTAEQAANIQIGTKVKVVAALQHYYKAATESSEEFELAETVAGGSLGILELDSFSLNISCDITKGRVDNLNGTYAFGTQITVTATPNYGYHFVQWSDGVKHNPRTIVLTQNTTLTAEFAAVVPDTIHDTIYIEVKDTIQTLYVESAESSKGSVRVQIVAEAEAGYEFLCWSDFNTENPRTVVLDSKNVQEYIAYFRAQESPASVSAITSEEELRKYIEQGNVYILRGNKVYTVTGQEVR